MIRLNHSRPPSHDMTNGRGHQIAAMGGGLSVRGERRVAVSVVYQSPADATKLVNEVSRIVAMADHDSTITPAMLSPDIQASRRTLHVEPGDEPEVRVRLDQPLGDAVDAIERVMGLRASTQSRALPRVYRAGRLRIGYSGTMNAKVSIEVDRHTADVLETRAAELGLTVPQLIAELAALDGAPEIIAPFDTGAQLGFPRRVLLHAALSTLGRGPSNRRRYERSRHRVSRMAA